ncbi:membrane protein [Paramyrothecium foliicola]|nr:membrane protein [Paramyrothecium foliicola]
MEATPETGSRHVLSPISTFLHHVGLVSLYQSTFDVKLLCMQRFVRLFAYGASTLVLVSFLRELEISKAHIGLFMTLTLAGDVAISFILACYADGIGRKWTLVLGALLMVASGVVFALSSSYWILLVAAVFGVISPSGNEIGPFRAVEESTIAHLTVPENRGDIYAWYSLVGSTGAAFGTMACGWAIEAAQHQLGWQMADVYRLAFYGYASLGLVKAVLALMLSPSVEADAKQDTSSEQAPLLQSATAPQTKPKKRPLFPQLSSRGMKAVATLCVLFALDSFASGLVPSSWIMYYFKSRFNLMEGSLGSIFFVTNIIAAGSTLVASSLAKRLGNVPTMVFTHIPSAVFLALIPIPNQLQWSLTFLILRSCIQSMDVAPRSAFLAAILRPEERTMSMGLINVVKTTSQSIGPSITGVLAEHNLFWTSFLCAGSLKICYDIGLLALFKNHEQDDADE